MNVPKAIIYVATVLLLASCVSQSKYDALLSELEESQSQVVALKSKNEDLQERVDELEGVVEEAWDHMKSASTWILMEEYFLANLEVGNAVSVLRNASY